MSESDLLFDLASEVRKLERMEASDPGSPVQTVTIEYRDRLGWAGTDELAAAIAEIVRTQFAKFREEAIELQKTRVQICRDALDTRASRVQE